jgi:polo-like kinase 1
MSELKIHRGIKHGHICQFENYFEDADNIYILLELCPNETLAEVMHRRRILHELEVQYYTLQVVSALKYMQDNLIVHRDLKPGNMLLGHNHEIKVADFGLSAKLNYSGERRMSTCGTPNYMAPE